MNCHHFRATQKSIPDAQELIWLGGGVKRPHPAPLGLNTEKSSKIPNYLQVFGFENDIYIDYHLLLLLLWNIYKCL